MIFISLRFVNAYICRWTRTENISGKDQVSSVQNQIITWSDDELSMLIAFGGTYSSAFWIKNQFKLRFPTKWQSLIKLWKFWWNHETKKTILSFDIHREYQFLACRHLIYIDDEILWGVRRLISMTDLNWSIISTLALAAFVNVKGSIFDRNLGIKCPKVLSQNYGFTTKQSIEIVISVEDIFGIHDVLVQGVGFRMAIVRKWKLCWWTN